MSGAYELGGSADFSCMIDSSACMTQNNDLTSLQPPRPNEQMTSCAQERSISKPAEQVVLLSKYNKMRANGLLADRQDVV